MDSDKVKLTSKLDFVGRLDHSCIYKPKARLLVDSDFQAKSVFWNGNIHEVGKQLPYSLLTLLSALS